VGRRWVDDDEAILLRELAVRAAGVVGLSGAGAVVDSNNDTGVCGELLRYVDVEAGLGGGSAERGDLLKAARCDGTLAERCR
jgi:hypothetical protein